MAILVRFNHNNYVYLQILNIQQSKAETDVRILGDEKDQFQKEWETVR